MLKVVANLKVFAAAGALFAVASFYNLSSSSAITPGTQLSVAPTGSQSAPQGPAVALNAPRS